VLENPRHRTRHMFADIAFFQAFRA